MEIKPIAYFRSPFATKFGVPRQSGVVAELHGSIVFADDFRQPEALRGLDGYDYLWLIWGFSENVGAKKRPTVRPPLLGGNERVGVWATRSPFRPNNLGLSAVRLVGVDAERMTIEVAGADLMDGTPVYDIKPYLPYADSYPGVRAGFTEQKSWHRLEVVFSDESARLLAADDRAVLKAVLEQDPRPHYHDSADRLYGMPFMGYDVQFRVDGDVLKVETVKKIC